jgi:hypothetical protein
MKQEEAIVNAHRSRPALATIMFGVLALGVVLADGGPEHRVRTMFFGSSGGNVNSIGSRYCCSGTLGALVADSQNRLYVLSNNHVLGLSGAAQTGDDVSQPGLIDNSCRQGALVADFTVAPELGPSNVDAAIAQLRQGAMDQNGNILDIGIPSSSIVAPSIGLDVQKSGRTTGRTEGEIGAINASVKVQYQQGCAQGRKFTITYVNQIVINSASFSAGGDSGSLIVTTGGSQPVGLLFAGSSSTTIANPIGEVLDAISASLTVPVSFNLPAAPNFTSSQPSMLTAEEVARGNAVKEAHAARLLDDPSIFGVGVGAEADNSGRAALIVYVAHGRGRGGIPSRINNVTTRVVETDPIVAYGWNEVAGQTCVVR